MANGKPDHENGHAVKGNIARDGAKKTPQTEFPPHSGMRHVATADDGSKVHAKNLSRTQAQQLLGTDGGLGAVNSGGQPKAYTNPVNKPVQPHPGMTLDQRIEHDPTSGKRVLDEAVLSGSHLPKK